MASRLQDVIQRGLSTAKPLATVVAPGTLYFSTDLLITERSDGTVWASYSGVSATTQLNLTELPFASLPVTPTIGTLVNVSNSTVNTSGSTIVGGGTFHVLGRWNGTNWIVVA